MKKLLLTATLFGCLIGSSNQAHAYESGIPMPLIMGTALAAVIITAVGKVVHTVGRNPRETLGSGIILGASATIGLVAYPAIQLAIEAGYNASELTRNNPGGLIGALAAVGAIAFWKFFIEKQLPTYSRDTKKIGSALMHLGGWTAVASGLLFGGMLLGY